MSNTPQSMMAAAVTAGRVRRLLLTALVLGSTAATAWHLSHSFAEDGIRGLETTFLLLFAISFCWIVLWFWTAAFGSVALLVRRGRPGFRWYDEVAPPPLRGRVALVMPIYNEDPARVFANLQAIDESLRATGQQSAFDTFVLSDSTDPDIWAAEELAWQALCRRTGGEGRIFYRRRHRNTAQKSGNIAEFCQRWGRRYDYMIVLDADSIMSGETLVALARLMDCNPRAGIIQTAPAAVNRSSLFGRSRQFANSLYGPLFTAGMASWQLGEACFWGHNAILRIEAFMRHCGLPELPGKPPFGGTILSHDFIEAALMRRAGWQVWMVPELNGSYEDSPPTLLAHAARDRRWCQGNLQHLRILPAQGLHPLGRLHIVSGVMAYGSSLVWLALILMGLAMAAGDRLLPAPYFTSERSLFPNWPAFDAQLAVNIFFVAMGALLLPRLAALLLVLMRRDRRRSFGGGVAATLSCIAETILSTLLAPVTMLLHARFVLGTLLGLRVSWNAQTRDDGIAPFWQVARQHAGHTAVGIALSAATLWASLDLFWWLSPVLLGLVLSIPLSYLTAEPRLGRLGRRLKLFLIPEETAPPEVLRRAAALEAGWRQEITVREAFERVLRQPEANALHLALLEVLPPGSAAASREPPAPGDDPGALAAAERLALLSDRYALLAWHRALLLRDCRGG